MIGVDVAFDTGQVDPPERLPAWRELVNRVFLPLDIAPLAASPGRPGAFGAAVTGSDRGELRVWRVRATPLSAVRAVRHIRSSGCDDYLLGLHVSGTAVGAQDDRQVTLGPGDFALFDSARPYRIAFRGPGVFEHVIFQVPRASLEARGRAVGTQTALRVPAASRAGRLASPYLRTLAQDEPPAQAFIDTGLDLAASALRATAGPDPGRPAPAGELKRYALAHLGDPALSPRAVARAGYLSVRQLHRLFAREGVSLTQDEPFQLMMMPAVGPLAVVLCPTAVTFPAPVAVTLSSRPWAGFGTTCHELPFQFSVNAAPFRLFPTAQASPGLIAVSPNSSAPLAGTGTEVHAVPFQCAVNGSSAEVAVSKY